MNVMHHPLPADRGGGKLRFNTQVKYVLLLLVFTKIRLFSHW